MITFIQSDVQNDIKEYFPGVEISDLLYSFRAIENDNIAGVCLFSFNKEKSSVILERIYISNSDISTEEGLIRAALNFAANRGTYMAYVKNYSEFNNDLLKRMHFEIKENMALCDIPTALTGNCCG